MGKIIIKQNDITKEDVDVIVNAANTTLRGGGGVDGAIHRAAGRSVLEECIKIGGCKTGDCAMTNAGKLKAKRIIHTVGPVYYNGKRNEASFLRRCYHNSFALAKEQQLKTIAFPAISTGAYGYPIEEATRIALQEGLKAQNDFDEIRYVCFSVEDLEIYERIYGEMTQV
ncbi:MAG: O-acetyl-ADP-ribose deacetylase [Candidatus Omnitrophota bacterium]